MSKELPSRAVDIEFMSGNQLEATLPLAVSGLRKPLVPRCCHERWPDLLESPWPRRSCSRVGCASCSMPGPRVLLACIASKIVCSRTTNNAKLRRRRSYVEDCCSAEISRQQSAHTLKAIAVFFRQDFLFSQAHGFAGMAWYSWEVSRDANKAAQKAVCPDHFWLCCFHASGHGTPVPRILANYGEARGSGDSAYS